MDRLRTELVNILADILKRTAPAIAIAAACAITGVVIIPLIVVIVFVILASIAVPKFGAAVVALLLLAYVTVACFRFWFTRRAQRGAAPGDHYWAPLQRAGAVWLRAWMAGTEQVLKCAEHATPAAAPVSLTPEDCAAAGFTFDCETRARYRIRSFTDLMLLRPAREFQVYFSPQRRHHAVFFKGFVHGPGTLQLLAAIGDIGERSWVAQWVAAILTREGVIVAPERQWVGGRRLWVDGRPAPVQLDGWGEPRVAALLHLLDRGRLTEDGNPVRPASLQAWLDEVGPVIAAGCDRLFDATYPSPPQRMTLEDCRAAGFDFDSEGYACVHPGGEGRICIGFSPDLRHHAVVVRWEYWTGAKLWVDGEAVPVVDSNGNPSCEDYANWLDNRFVYVQFGLYDHPLYEPATFNPLGNLRGLLVWDAVNCAVFRVERPDPTQAWTDPFIVARDGTWRIYRDRDALKQDRADRVVPSPDGAGGCEQGWLRPWYRLDNDKERRWLEWELQRELSEKHVLWKKAVTIIARRYGQDDVLARMSDGKVAEVHLTWRGATETDPRWPTTQVYATIDEWREGSMRPLHDYEKSMGSFDDDEEGDDSSSA